MESKEIGSLLGEVSEIVLHAAEYREDSFTMSKRILQEFRKLVIKRQGDDREYQSHLKYRCGCCLQFIGKQCSDTGLMHGWLSIELEEYNLENCTVDPLVDELYQNGKLVVPALCWGCWDRKQFLKQ